MSHNFEPTQAEKENWSLDEIRSTYNNAVKHCGKVTPEVAWWSSRKRRNHQI